MAQDANRDGYLQLIEARADIGRYLGPKRIGTTGGDGHFSMVFGAVDKSTGRIRVYQPKQVMHDGRVENNAMVGPATYTIPPLKRVD